MMTTTKSQDGTTIAYDVRGSGPALIYITGASCFRTFKPVVADAKAFARDFTVYTYDRRGRGDSGDTQPYAIEREVEDLDAMIDAAGGSAYLYGHSSGAVLALEAAMRLGGKVKRVVAYDPPYVHDERERLEYERLRQEIKALLDAGNNAKAMTRFLAGIGMPKAFVYLMPLFPGWKPMVTLAPTLMYDIELTRHLPPLDRMSGIAVPAKVVVGQKSPAGIHQVAARLSEAIPGAAFAELAGQGHMVGAKALLPLLTGFLTAAGGDTRPRT